MGGRGNVLVLPYLEGSASTTEREAGFLEAIKAYPGIRVLSAGQYAGATMEKAFQTAQNLLNRYPETEGVFCSTQPTTQAMLRALEVAGKKDRVKLVGLRPQRRAAASRAQRRHCRPRPCKIPSGWATRASVRVLPSCRESRTPKSSIQA
jgi:ribose transport system substrate-binding protein